MNILFCVRHNFHDAPGGAQIQILKTIEYLKKLGVNCDITTSPYNINYNKYDILHLTDLTWVYDNIVYFNEIKKQNFKGKKVLSTIYWPFDDYANNGAPLLQKMIFKILGINGFEFFKALAKFILKRNSLYIYGLKNTYISNQIKILNNVDWLLPNAESEMKVLNKRLNLNYKNYSVANNAIDTNIIDNIEKNIKKDPNLITFVARIDPRKNQMNFLKAIYNTSYKIRFIGNPGPNSNKYYNELVKLAKNRGNVEFISHISQEEVFKHMLESKVNVLTSWIETPGLVSIEALYCGCNIVISNKGSVKDYFQDFAYYCEPDNINDIKNKVNKAMSSTFNEDVLKLIKDNYSWEKTAEQTYQVYKKLLD